MTPDEVKRKLDNDIKLLEWRNERNETFADAIGRMYGTPEKKNVYDTLAELKQVRQQYESDSDKAKFRADVFTLQQRGMI